MAYVPLVNNILGDQLQDQLIDPEFCREQRKQARRQFTSTCTKISKLIQARGSRTTLSIHKGELDQQHSDCLTWHRHLVACSPSLSEQQASKWEDELETQYDSYIGYYRAYLDLKSHEESLNLAPASSTRGRKAAKLEELEKRKQKLEVERSLIEQQKNQIEDQIESLHLQSASPHESSDEELLERQSGVATAAVSNQEQAFASTPVTASSRRPSIRLPQQSFEFGVPAPSIGTSLNPSAPVYRPGSYHEHQPSVRFSVSSDAASSSTYHPVSSNTTSFMLGNDVSFWPVHTTTSSTNLVWSTPTVTSVTQPVGLSSTNPFSFHRPPIPPRTPKAPRSDPSSVPQQKEVGPVPDPPRRTAKSHEWFKPFEQGTLRQDTSLSQRPDFWINSRAEESMSAAEIRGRLPRIEVPKFDGNPREWLNFISIFHATVHRTSSDSVFRISMLRQALAPSVRDLVGNLLAQPDGYYLALEELQRIYGEPSLVVNSHLDALKELPLISDHDPMALRNFAARVNGAITNLTSSGFAHELASTEVMNIVTNKLPVRIRTIWANRKAELREGGVLPTLVHCVECLNRTAVIEQEAHVASIKPVAKKDGKTAQPQKKAEKGTPAKQSAASYAVQVSQAECVACDGNHESATCKLYMDLSLDDKVKKLKEKKACYRCLGRSHRAQDCPRKDCCGINECKKAHHPTLHGVGQIYAGAKTRSSHDASAPAASSSTSSASNSAAAYTTGASVPSLDPDQPIVALNVVPIFVAANGKSVRTFALLDSGSSATIIHEDIRKALELNGSPTSCSLSTLGGANEVPCRSISFSLLAIDGSARFEVARGLALDHLDMPRRSFNPSQVKKNWPHLADLSLDSRDIIQAMVLVGRDIDCALDVIEKRRPPAGSDGPVAERTVFGWSIVGPVRRGPHSVQATATSVSSNQEEDADLHQMVSRSFDLDSIGVTPRVKPLMPSIDRQGLSILEARTLHNGERYQVGLMWKSIDVKLPDNYSSAFRRLLSLERKFKKDPAMAVRYATVINEYISLGHARKLSSSELPLPPGRHWFLPHLAVEQPNKTRVVFDPSSRHQGICLNDVLLKGPDLLTNLLDLLTRFRRNLIPLSADIEKMYHQVLVEKSEQPFFAFLWRHPGSTGSPEVYVMTVHIFGAISSPATCMYALRRVAEDFRESFPDVADLVLNNFYVDNFLDSVDSEEDAVRIREHLTALLKLGGFRLTKWLTSSRQVLASVPTCDRSKPNLDINFDDLPIEKTLGLLWNSNEDSFRFRMKQFDASTKRGLLRTVSSIFDPLGMLAPIILKARILLKKIWASDLAWDDPLPDHFLSKWTKWTSDLLTVESLRIPRCLKSSSAKAASRSLHCFCDASSDGYSAVIYLRTVYDSGHCEMSFVLGKSRVSPMKFSTIHRLELQAALLGCRVALSLSDALGISKGEAIFWSDSQTVLKWLNSKTMKFHVFVANRVADILDNTTTSQWRYVPTADNPADDCSRGLHGAELSASHRWFTGPSFLSSPEESWPELMSPPEPRLSEPEVAGPVVALVTSARVAVHPIAKVVNDSSSWIKCLRIVARMKRMAPRNKHLRLPRSDTRVSVDELAEAELLVIRFTQQDSFADDLKLVRVGKEVPLRSPLIRLTPFFGDDGLLRVGGRLSKSDLPVSTVHPIILPQNHAVTNLIIRFYHQNLRHASPSRTLSDLVQKFWIIHGRSAVSKVYYDCFFCRKRTVKPQLPLMAPLPSDRVRAFEPPFTVTGIDYFGPIEVIILRRRVKRYGVIFTCLNTRAVHLEVAASLDTDSFLMAFRRFTNIRGRVSICYSDNGTNLVAGEKEIRTCLRQWNQEHISNDLAQQNVKWVFNPPAAPHFGGVWERLVRSAKSALKIILHGRPVTDEILATAMTEVSSLLNGRPLTHLGVDSSDPEPLTPNHFLQQRPQPALPPAVSCPSDISSRKRWRIVQALADHFWRRWLREYLPFLTERRKWLTRSPNLQVNDIVIIADPNTPRGEWPLARVLQVFPDAAGTVRAALVKTSTGCYVRPVAKLCLLESSDPLHPSPDSNSNLDSASAGIERGNVATATSL